MKKIWIWILLVMMLVSSTALCEVESVPQGAAAVVNGEVLLQADVDAVATQYMNTLASAGADTESQETKDYINALSLNMCIETMVIRQDMMALGMYHFVDEGAFDEAAQQAYLQMLNGYIELMVSSYGLDAESARTNAISILDTYGYTVEYFVEYYKEYTAAEKYKAYLMEEEPEITDQEIMAEYQLRLEDSKNKYAQDVSAFETALNNNLEVWYVPEGYRQVLQIFLPAAGDTDAEKLAAVADTMDMIEKRLADGESFEALIREYGQDTSFEDESFFEVGYSVHSQSIMWADAFVAAAFSDEMAAPGDHSLPICSDTGVHILYYLKDRESGPVAYDADVENALYREIYDDRANEKVAAYGLELMEKATILYPEGE